jgi:hypothetical protein
VNKWGGNNKVLNAEEEEAIRQYCYEQWEFGLGATRQMAYGAICFLKRVGLLTVLLSNLPLILGSRRDRRSLHVAGSIAGSKRTRTSTLSRRSQLRTLESHRTRKKTYKSGFKSTIIPSRSTRLNQGRMC